MNVLLLLAVAGAAFLIAGRFYGAYISRSVGLDPDRPTPAQTLNDGRDYVPSKPYVVFAHHFSAIAGAGPIVGPTVAILYGVMPAWIWVIVGGIFIGAVHDFTAIFVSLREGGKSMAEIARKTLGNAGFNLFVLFTLLMLVLVNAAFLSMTAISLTSLWPVEKLGLGPDGGHILRTIERDGEVYGQIGGIASTSVIVITLCSPLLGWLLHRRGLRARYAFPLASLICVASIVLGIIRPVTLPSVSWPIAMTPEHLWMLILSVYVLVAAGVPVWAVLQPRDFINVQILYAGIGLLLVGLVVAGFMGMPFHMPAFNVAQGNQTLGFIWPMMFITIACGAISGFHSVVAGGTTVKQLAREPDARRIGFNAMLLESLLAVAVILALGVGLTRGDYLTIVHPEEGASNPVLAFALGAGMLFKNTLGIPVELATVFGILMVEGFVVTTLDASVRLNRYLLEELWPLVFRRPPALVRNPWFNSGVSVVLMLVMAWGNGFRLLWSIFGTGNQLLAAFALMAVSGWLLLRGRRVFYALIPAAFMVATTLTSLVILLRQYIAAGNYLLMGAAVLLLVLSVSVVLLVLAKIVFPMFRAKAPAPAGEAGSV